MISEYHHSIAKFIAVVFHHDALDSELHSSERSVSILRSRADGERQVNLLKFGSF